MRPVIFAHTRIGSDRRRSSTHFLCADGGVSYKLCFRSDLINDPRPIPVFAVSVQGGTMCWMVSGIPSRGNNLQLDFVALTFSFRICASSSGEKSFWMLNSFRISSVVLPLIMLALPEENAEGNICRPIPLSEDEAKHRQREKHTWLRMRPIPTQSCNRHRGEA